ncbi:hypothetical protein [Sediminicola luteus]|uniref:Uncharacterized protein n=1 Tax=Sediminicola luteus TaxID=319238 RepID=A0A2A4G392_9FLAO|nr:hypothetical protein [Sediminicola luteus]PCE62893.1 hypothetical protein B7P33_16590 [Sediminicola luteus]
MNRILLLPIFALFSLTHCGKKDGVPEIVEKTTPEGLELRYTPAKATYSGNALVLIARDPNFVPSQLQQRKALHMLAKSYPDYEIRSVLRPQVTFIDSGSNFESVHCNLCGKEIPTAHWQEAMGRAYTSAFNDLSFQTVCCNQKGSLNDLDYRMPCGFAKYEIRLEDFDSSTNRNAEVIQELQQLLKQEIKLVWVHN